jgi:endoglucanase
MELEKLLEKLSNAHGISGYENNVKQMAAHMDEIGLMVQYIDDNGFLHFVKIGGWFDQTLHSQRVVVHGSNGQITGVIGSKPPHVMKEEDRKKPVKAEDMFIDIGAKDKEDAMKMGVDVGTAISMDRDFASLANGLVTCKAFDNRAGVTMLIDAMRQISETKVNATIHAVGTVQEEVGLKGARTSAFGLNPDVAIAVDVTFPGDHPGISKNDSAL